MRKIFDKLVKLPLAAGLATGLFLFLIPRPVLGEDIVFPGYPLGDPSSAIRQTAPSMSNSLFPRSATSGNTATVTGGTVGGHVFGGIAADSGANAVGNNVNITGGTIGTSTTGGNVFGGWSYDSGVTGNSVNITNAIVRGIVFGGWRSGGTTARDVSGNTVTIGSGATARDNIYGGYSQGQGGVISGNQVIIDGGGVTKNDAIIAGGYSALLLNTVSGNSVIINGGTINNARIYGGRGQVDSPITSNTVTINGGTIANGAIYGGQNLNNGAVNLNSVSVTGGSVNAEVYGGHSNGGGKVTENKVSITGGVVTGDIYGGYSNRGSATYNTVTIGGAANLGAGYNLFGGYVNSGVGDAFTGNILNKNNAALVNSARNFEFVNFGYSGNANIGTLYTTPTGSARPGVILDTSVYNVNFGGLITGAGSLTKTGAGTLILTGANTYSGGTTVSEGTLRIGNGGAIGSIVGNIVNNALVIFNRSDDVSYSGQITGSGKVVQSGSGTLSLTGANTYSSGTEIESGTLLITNNYSYNQATDPLSNTGYITFTGPDAARTKNATLRTFSDIFLTNSFRTQTGAGVNNYVNLTSNLTPSPWVAITGVNTGPVDNGGAFYVADGTAMNVAANNLQLFNNLAGGQLNDLYVESGGTFNLKVGSTDFNDPSMAVFMSGIDGDGRLNISTDGPAAVVFWSNAFFGQTDPFRMGTTEIFGSEDNLALLWLTHEPGSPRLSFINTDGFSIHGSPGDAPVSAALMGDGIVTAGNGINVTDGAALAPSGVSPAGSYAPGTLTLDAPTIKLTDFALFYMASPALIGTVQDPLNLGADGIPDSNNDLLNIISTNPVTLENGTVYFKTADGNPFTPGNYLVIRSNNGFTFPSGGVNDDLSTIYVDGFELSPNGDGPRGGYGFLLGGDPNASGDPTGGAYNVWFGHTMNSLSMAWTGDGGTETDPLGGNWASGDFFYSWQDNVGEHEHRFLTGDKVYISGSNRFEIKLPGASDPFDLTSPKIVVSGLVVGRDMAGSDTDGGTYIISGAGGITADANSAFGGFVGGSLIPTGKLQKYGDSTLTFTNTGGNLFKEGIELYGGAVEFTRGNQLGTDNNGIHFFGNSTLRALNNVELDNDVKIDDNVTGGFGAAAGAFFTYTGQLSGSDLSVFDKTGAGTVRLDEPFPSAFEGAVTVSAGTLEVAGDYSQTTRFNVRNSGTLAGTGIIGATLGGGTVESGGTLKPGSAVAPFIPLTVIGDLTFAGGSNFGVRVKGLSSNQVIVDGGMVTIDPAAKLNADVDYWSIPKGDHAYTVIDASAGGVDDYNAEFDLYPFGLPRGVMMEQGWNRPLNLFQLSFSYDPNKGFGSIARTHNQREIGKTMDWFTINRDPGISPLIDRLSDSSWTDSEVSRQLDQIHGDLTPNALFMAFKEPWRHPFSRLEFVSDSSSSSDDRQFRPRAWSEFTLRHKRVRNDGNAHGFTLNRPGVAVGVDFPLSERTIAGVTFQYANPSLRQDTGKVRAEDFEIGLYGLTRLPYELDLKAYLGYSHQQYDFKRNVSLPASPSGRYGVFHEKLSGSASGKALAASLELTRSFQVRPDFRLMPVAALDYEKAWIGGYRESGGMTSLVHDDASLEQMRLRVGMDSELTFQNGFFLKPKVQYAMRVKGDSFPSVGTRFANGTLPDQRTADIWGSRIGRNSFDIGLSAGLKMGSQSNASLYLKYEAEVFNRATSQTGEIGFTIKW